MKIAAIYDIHGNVPALEAVLAEIETIAVDAIVIGGDALGGPMPLETLALLRNLTVSTHFIHGNHESEVLRWIDTGVAGGLSEVADKAAQWVAEQLSAEQQTFIRTWHLSVTLDVAGIGKVLFCHANPQDDITIFTEQTPDARVQEVLSDFNADLIVCGHTHMQFEREIGGARVTNAGSVGMPFGTQGAHWLLLDGDVQFKCTEYDYKQAAARILTSDDPTAAGFAQGNVLSVPSAEDALAFMQKIAASQQTQ